MEWVGGAGASRAGRGGIARSAAALGQAGDHGRVRSGRVLGVDACRAGWVGIALSGEDVQPYSAPVIRELADRAAADGPLPVIAIDIPIGLADTGRRRADQLAREALGRRWPSLFITPVRAAVEADGYPAAAAENRRRAGEGLSRQAFALHAKILDVDEWLRAVDSQPGKPARGSPGRVEAHPELSFAAMAGAPLRSRKTTWAGAAERRALLARPAFSCPTTLARPATGPVWTTCSMRPRRPGPPGGSARVPPAACPRRRRFSATGFPPPSGPERRSGTLQGAAAQMPPQPGQQFVTGRAPRRDFRGGQHGHRATRPGGEERVAGRGQQPHAGHRDARRGPQRERAVPAEQQRLPLGQAAGRPGGQVRRAEQQGAVVHGDGRAEPRRLAVQRNQRRGRGGRGERRRGLGPGDRTGVPRARYRARCAHASAGAPGGSAAAVSGISITPGAVTVARSAAGVISMAVPARADTCP